MHQLNRLRAVLLLAGSVRPTSLRKATGRFIIDLPVEDDKTILDLWHDHLNDLAYELNLEKLPARVLIDRSSQAPEPGQQSGPADLQIQRDPLSFRGTGGLVSDIAGEYDDDDYIIIANAAQVLLAPLPRLIEAMARKQADVSLLCDADHRPNGITLIRCGALRDIPKVGFVDLNEQALPQIARKHAVKVCCYEQPAGYAIRTRQDYLEAVRTHYRRIQGRCRLSNDLLEEDWDATFGIIESGSFVDPSAVIHDSVVLAGGRVEAGAVLVRAIVAAHGRVGPGESAVECIISPSRGASRDG